MDCIGIAGVRLYARNRAKSLLGIAWRREICNLEIQRDDDDCLRASLRLNLSVSSYFHFVNPEIDGSPNLKCLFLKESPREESSIRASALTGQKSTAASGKSLDSPHSEPKYSRNNIVRTSGPA